MQDDSIAAPGLAHRAMAPELDLIADLMGGTASMRRAGQRWLPREANESWTAWRARLHRSVLFNGMSRTVMALAGRPFARPVALADAAPALAALAGSVDGAGTGIGGFAACHAERRADGIHAGPPADLRFVEHSGAAIAAGRQDLIDLEDRMAVLGLDMLRHRPGETTATGRAIDAAQTHAALNGIVQTLEDGLVRAFRLADQAWLLLQIGLGGYVVGRSVEKISPQIANGHANGGHNGGHGGGQNGGATRSVKSMPAKNPATRVKATRAKAALHAGK